MRNLADPAVAAAVRAMGRAQSLRSGKAPRLAVGQSLDSVSDYLIAVDEYKTALRAAQQKAEIRGLDDFNDKERRNIEQARLILALALDPASAEAERQAAYDRVVNIVKKLKALAVPTEAYARIELASGVTRRALIEASVNTSDRMQAAA